MSRPWLALVLVVFLVLGPAVRPAQAGLTARALEGVTARPAPGATLPLDAVVRDGTGRERSLGDALAGRPALLMPVDYTCRALCGPSLSLLAPLLPETRFRLGRDYAVLVLGIDPRDGPETARAMTQERLGPVAGEAGIAVLTARPEALDRIFASLGYATAFDRERDRLAHPAAAFAVAGDGRVVRTLSTLALDVGDLDLALTEAGQGRLGGLGDRLVLLCYGFDPVLGIYTPAIQRVLALSAAMTLVGLAGAVWGLVRRSRRRGVA